MERFVTCLRPSPVPTHPCALQRHGALGCDVLHMLWGVADRAATPCPNRPRPPQRPRPSLKSSQKPQSPNEGMPLLQRLLSAVALAGSGELTLSQLVVALAVVTNQ